MLGHSKKSAVVTKLQDVHKCDVHHHSISKKLKTAPHMREVFREPLCARPLFSKV